MLDTTTYLLSSFIDNPNQIFQGYCFIQQNFVFENEGAEKYIRDTGKEIPFGEDGCYVIARKIDDNYIIGADSAGYKKIIYYHDKTLGNWVVSNSLNLIIEHLSHNGVQVTPDVESIMMMGVGTSATQQPVTFGTIAKEIKILPMNTILKIGSKGLKIESCEENIFSSVNYEDMLINFVQMWVSRFATLLSYDDLLIQQSLTGGLDSRAVFSLSTMASQALENKQSADHRLSCSLTNGSDIDIVTADNITSSYGYELNKKGQSTNKVNYLNTEDNYLIWKNLCLGVYHPIYFPEAHIDYRKIKIGGGGGENYRPFYAKRARINAYRDFAEELTRKIKQQPLRAGFAIELYETLLDLQKTDSLGYEVDPLILHYRHFRNRFHIGLSPQYRVSFNPLSSKYLSPIAKKANAHKIESLQVLYDLISMTEGLLDLPFDSVEKAPSIENRCQLIQKRFDKPILAGKIFANSTPPKSLNKKPARAPLFAMLKKDFDKARNTKVVSDLWSTEFVEDAANNLNTALQNGKFSSAKHGIPVSAIIATGLLDYSV